MGSIDIALLSSLQVVEKIAESYAYKVNAKPFPVLNVHYPVFSTRSIHRNYVDCVRYLSTKVTFCYKLC